MAGFFRKKLSGRQGGADVNVVLQTIDGVVDVFGRPILQLLAFVRSESFDDFSRRTQDERAGRDFHPLFNQRVCADERLFTDFRAVENGRPHADQTFVANGARVDDGRVADGHVIADDAAEVIGEVKDGVVLNIAVMTDGDAIDVAAQNGVIPDAGMVAERDVADDDAGAGNINVLANRWLFTQKCIELLLERHADVLNQLWRKRQYVIWFGAMCALYLSWNG